MKSSWKNLLGLLVVGGVACLAVGCKTAGNGSQASNPFPNPFKSLASKPATTAATATAANPRPSVGAKTEITVPPGGYSTAATDSRTTAPAYTATAPASANPYAPADTYAAGYPAASGFPATPAATAPTAAAYEPAYAQQYASTAAVQGTADSVYGGQPQGYTPTAYYGNVPRDPRTDFQDIAASPSSPYLPPQPQPTQGYGQPMQQQQPSPYSVPQAYDGMYQQQQPAAAQANPYAPAVPEQSYQGYTGYNNVPATTPGPYSYR